MVNLFITETDLPVLPPQLSHPGQKDLILAKPESWLIVCFTEPLLVLPFACFQAAKETARAGCLDDIKSSLSCS